MGVAPRKPLGGGGWDAVPNIGSGYCAMMNTGIWAIAQLREARRTSSTASSGCPPLPAANTPPSAAVGRSSPMRRARIRRRRASSVAWALGSPKDGSTRRIVDWCTVAKTDMPPTKSALEGGKAAYASGFLKVFAEQVYPSARAEPRMPPPIYKAISDAIQGCQLNGQRSCRGGQDRIRSDRRVPFRLQGRADPVMRGASG